LNPRGTPAHQAGVLTFWRDVEQSAAHGRLNNQLIRDAAAAWRPQAADHTFDPIRAVTV